MLALLAGIHVFLTVLRARSADGRDKLAMNSAEMARHHRKPLSMANSDMSDYIKPNDRKDIEAAVQWAVAGGKSLEVVGHGSKRALGRPAQYDATIDLSGVAGVILYEPQELILSAKAG